MKNLRNNKYAQRLIGEWRQHGKIIIGCDYDDTIRRWRLNSQEECDKVIDILKLCKDVGCYLVVFTACNTDRYEEIENFCNSKKLQFDSINQNPISLPYGNNTKIYANIFIDDRAGLREALDILEFAAYTIRGEQHNVTEQTVEF